MSATAVFALLFALTVCVYASISDFLTERVANCVLLVATTVAVVLDVVQYCFIAPDLLLTFILNMAATCTFSLVLFYTHTWAGGDCKLAGVLAMLYPAEAYLVVGEISITLPLAIGIAFVLGAACLLMLFLARLIRDRPKISMRAIGTSFFAFAQSYLCALACIGVLYLINEWLIAPHMQLSPIAVAAFGFCCIWLLSSANLLKSRILLAVMLVFDIIGGLTLQIVPLGASPLRYAFVLAVVLLRIVVSQQNYRTIPTAEVEPGMILATSSSLMFANSRVRGLPGISTEDLRSRLTEEEVASVRRWGESAKGREEVQVVRKMPFAVFVSSGFVAYFTLWGICKWLLV